MGRIFENMDNKQNNITEAIIKTIAFFDLFDYPLTSDEIWKFLWLPDGAVNMTEADIAAALANLAGMVETRDGFYFLDGRQEIIDKRKASRPHEEKKIRIARRLAGCLKYLAGVKMVAVVNSVVLGSVKQDSDIDLFIVTAAGRLWLVRFVVTLFAQLLGIRRHGNQISDRLCLSFYVTEDQLDLSAVRYPTDPYFYYWLATLQPIYDDGCYEKFIAANRWVSDRLPNFSLKDLKSDLLVRDNRMSKVFQTVDGWCFYSFFGESQERLARVFQKRKMARNLSSLASEPDSRVIISDTMLKFHESDRREEFRRAWEEKYRLILAKL